LLLAFLRKTLYLFLGEPLLYEKIIVALLDYGGIGEAVPPEKAVPEEF
jgi:hypothetical protein